MHNTASRGPLVHHDFRMETRPALRACPKPQQVGLANFGTSSTEVGPTSAEIAQIRPDPAKQASKLANIRSKIAQMFAWRGKCGAKSGQFRPKIPKLGEIGRVRAGVGRNSLNLSDSGKTSVQIRQKPPALNAGRAWPMSSRSRSQTCIPGRSWPIGGPNRPKSRNCGRVRACGRQNRAQIRSNQPRFAQIRDLSADQIRSNSGQCWPKYGQLGWKSPNSDRTRDRFGRSRTRFGRHRRNLPNSDQHELKSD